MGIPMAGGEIYFDESYEGNPLVNAMCLGIMKSDDLIKGSATGIGNPVFYVGAATGKDGLGGASFASKDLSEERGSCPDASDYGMKERFSNKTAIAPTASISIICGGASPGVEPIAANSYTHKTLSGSFNVRNKYLAKLLEKHSKNDDETWSGITTNQGSVSHLDFLNKEEKDVFKTAFELDQKWIVELGANRTPFVSQAQSINIFLPADVHKKELHQIHFQAWKKGLKSLYYCRSKSIQRAENINNGLSTSTTIEETKETKEKKDYEECLSCQ